MSDSDEGERVPQLGLFWLQLSLSATSGAFMGIYTGDGHRWEIVAAVFAALMRAIWS